MVPRSLVISLRKVEGVPHDSWCHHLECRSQLITIGSIKTIEVWLFRDKILTDWNLKISDSQSTLEYLVIRVRLNLEHSMNLSIFWGSAGPKPLRISRSLSMAEFSVKSFALFTWWRVFEACSQICYYTDPRLFGQQSQITIFCPVLMLTRQQVLVPMLVW